MLSFLLRQRTILPKRLEWSFDSVDSVLNNWATEGIRSCSDISIEYKLPLLHLDAKETTEHGKIATLVKLLVLHVTGVENAHRNPGTHHVKKPVLLLATDLDQRKGHRRGSVGLLPDTSEEGDNRTHWYATQFAIVGKDTGSILFHMDCVKGVVVHIEMCPIAVTRQRTIRWKGVLLAFHEVQFANRLDSVFIVLEEWHNRIWNTMRATCIPSHIPYENKLSLFALGMYPTDWFSSPTTFT